MLHTAQVAATGANSPGSVVSLIVSRIWHIMDLRNRTPQDIHDTTGIPMDTLFHLYNGTADLTVDQLVDFCKVLDVPPAAVFAGITDQSTTVPRELFDRDTAKLAARLHRMPVMARAMLLAEVNRRTENG